MNLNLLRRAGAVLAALGGTLLALVAFGGTPAFASPVHVPGGGLAPPLPGPAQIPAQVPVRTIVTGGMPGWQITLIAAAAALVAAVAAVLIDRVRAGRRTPASPARA